MFNGGKGKSAYQHDFGEGYEGVKEVGIFVWDKPTKKVYRVQMNEGLVPAYVTFGDNNGTNIIFHAYKRQSFGYGILHCLNRPVSIYKGTLTIEKE